jgi:hypothetical protein
LHTSRLRLDRAEFCCIHDARPDAVSIGPEFELAQSRDSFLCRGHDENPALEHWDAVFETVLSQATAALDAISSLGGARLEVVPSVNDPTVAATLMQRRFSFLLENGYLKTKSGEVVGGAGADCAGSYNDHIRGWDRHGSVRMIDE